MAKRRWTTVKDLRLESGKTYRDVRLVGGSETRGVLHVDYSVRDVMLDGFLVEPGPQNGITINCRPGVHVENLLLRDGRVRAQPRMGFECTDRRSDAVYRRVDQVDVRYEAQGNQAISYDGPRLPAACSLTGVVVDGAGENPAQPKYETNCLEFNGPLGFRVTESAFSGARGHILNMQTGEARFYDSVFSQLERDAEPWAHVIWARGWSGTFMGCRLVAAGTAGELGYLDACRDVDLSASELHDTRGPWRVTVLGGGNVYLPDAA
jgi:hypothetical protein